MQSILFSALVFIAFALSLVWRKYRLASYLYCLMFFSDLIELKLGLFSAPAWSLSSFLIVFLFSSKLLFKSYRSKLLYITKPLFEFLLISLILMLIFGPYLLFETYPAGNERYLVQGYLGRSLISSFRFFLEILSIYGSFLLFSKLGHNGSLKILYWVGLTSISYGSLNYISNGYLNSILFPGSRLDLSNRMIAMNGEPRVFGQSMIILFLVFFLEFIESRKLKSILVSVLFLIFLVFSFSTTSMVTLGFVCLAVISQNINFRRIKKIFRLVLPILLFSSMAFLLYTGIFSNSEIYSSLLKKTSVIFGLSDYRAEIAGDSNDVLPIFSRLEVFDRAAMNFMADNPIFMLIGTGPNTVSIPASDYIDSYSKLIYGNRIDSVPYSGLINSFTWAGLVGLLVLSRFYLRLFRLTSQNSYSRNLLIASFAVFLLIKPSSLWMLYGYVISCLTFSKDDKSSPKVLAQNSLG
jgi:hypothetical protein